MVVRVQQIRTCFEFFSNFYTKFLVGVQSDRAYSLSGQSLLLPFSVISLPRRQFFCNHHSLPKIREPSVSQGVEKVMLDTDDC